MDGLKVLGTEQGREDHAIIKAQGATEQFGHVSQIWERQCLTFEQGRKVLADQQAQIEDFREPLSKWAPIVTDKGQFAFRHLTDGRDYQPTDHAIGLMCQVGRGMGDWAVRALREPIRHATKVDPASDDGEKLPLFQRDERDSAVLRDYVALHLFAPDRVNQDKTRLFRTWKDGTLRAFLSEQYAIVNNGWYLDLLSKLIPGGLLSHWKGDADSIYGNILIPDTIRKESDSDYGGMLSVGNSEIGLRRISSCPSVFRAICMNGCIWEQEQGVEIDIRHRGKVNFADLAKMIGENLEAQIPLLPQGIAKVLNLQTYGFGDAPVQGLFAQLSLDHGLGKKEIAGVQKAFWEEVAQVGPKDGKTAFGFMGAITRYGQTRDAAGWVKYDMMGGNIANMDRDDWDKFCGRAKNLTAKQIEKRLGDLGPVA